MEKTIQPFLQALLRKAEDTQNTYKSIVWLYIRFVKENKCPIFKADSVINFLNYLEKEGYSQSSLATTYSAIKFFFNVYEQKFDTTIIPKPKVNIYEQAHPSISVEKINQMINAVKQGNIPQQKAFLAISTTFGLRNVELCNLKKQDIKQENGNYYIFIQTQKGGFPRWHLIPSEIEKYVVDYSFSPISKTEGNIIFKSICNLAGFNGKETKGFGWHAIRRTLITELYAIQGLPEYLLNSFFRYGIAKNTMVNRYSRLDGNNPQLLEMDREIFKKHPFIKIWGDT